MNVDNMEAGRVLDALVAERVMEEKQPIYVYPWQQALFVGRKSKGGNWIWSVSGYDSGDISGWYARPFSTDIVAAWEIVEKIRKVADGFSMADFVDGSFEVAFGSTTSGEASTAPLAICKAALEYIKESVKAI